MVNTAWSGRNAQIVPHIPLNVRSVKQLCGGSGQVDYSRINLPWFDNSANTQALPSPFTLSSLVKTSPLSEDLGRFHRGRDLYELARTIPASRISSIVEIELVWRKVNFLPLTIWS